MTPVDTPPPRLPVRDPSDARQRPWGSVSPMLNRLAAEHATGVLVRERGTLYLSEGRVVHAESPATPGIDVLLTAGGAVDAEGWQRAVAGAEADPERPVGRTLISQGMLSQGQLELCHLGTLFDAAYFALAPSSAPGHFRYGAWHWMGHVRPVPVSALERETMRRRSLLNRIWPDPSTDTAPLTAVRADRPGPVCARRQAILDLVDGRRTATDIARELGRPAFHTLVDLRRLAAAGLVAATHRPAAPPRPATAAGAGNGGAATLPGQPTARSRPAVSPAPPAAPVPPVRPLPPPAPQPARSVRPPDAGVERGARHHPDVDVPPAPRPSRGRHRAGRAAPHGVPRAEPHAAPTAPPATPAPGRPAGPATGVTAPSTSPAAPAESSEGPPPRTPVAAPSQTPPAHFADPDLSLLRRLRAALEAL
ncbi:hypothetical protein [Streptomyces sp. MJP52]|uniref:hypothetical protein n=1 Tax=Streptomyces sp. MJP52 TaxID=2940555 RepID=UPI00247B50F5|nr:hypothetical protein [Streptomyces sp. MJP52]